MVVAAFDQPKKQSAIAASIGLPVMWKCAKYARDYSVRAVAQLGRAPGSGPGGRGFKSHQPDEPSATRRERCGGACVKHRDQIERRLIQTPPQAWPFKLIRCTSLFRLSAR